MLLQKLLRDIEDEMLWVGEKEPLAASQDLGASLTAVQNLQKKHQVGGLRWWFKKDGSHNDNYSLLLLGYMYIHNLVLSIVNN